MILLNEGRTFCFFHHKEGAGHSLEAWKWAVPGRPVLRRSCISHRLPRLQLKSQSLIVNGCSNLVIFIDFWRLGSKGEKIRGYCFGAVGKECHFVRVIVSVRELIPVFCVPPDTLKSHILKVGENVIRLHLRNKNTSWSCKS